MEEKKPKVFISYAWTSEEYIKRVADFVKRLRGDGIETLFDQFDLETGNSLNDFMEKCVSDPTISHVLMLLNPAYKEKADSRSGGAGRETQIISEEVYSNLENSKFKPVIFDIADKQIKDVVPIYLKNRMYIDLSSVESFEDNYRVLVRELYGKPHLVKNQLGEKPSWVDESKTLDVNLGKIALIRESMARGIEKLTYSKSLELIKTEFINVLRHSNFEDINATNYEEKYKGLSPIRNLFLATVIELAELDRINEFIIEFFEYIDSSYKGWRQNGEAGKSLVLKILKHELIIEVVAILYKRKKYSCIYDLLTNYYETSNAYDACVGFHDFFYCMSESKIFNLDKALVQLLSTSNRDKFTGIGDCWIRNIPAEYLSSFDFVNADILITALIGILLGDRWFALTYVYSNSDDLWIRTVERALTNKRLFEKYHRLFGKTDKTDLKKMVIADYKRKEHAWLGYSNCNRRIPILFEYQFDENKILAGV